MLCDLLDLTRSSYYYVPQIRDDQKLRDAIEQTCLRYPRYGYRRVTPVLKKEQYRVWQRTSSSVNGRDGVAGSAEAT